MAGPTLPVDNPTKMQQLMESFRQLYRQRREGSLPRWMPPAEARRTVRAAMALFLPQEIADSLLLLTELKFRPIHDAPMAVSISSENKGIQLWVDDEMLDLLAIWMRENGFIRDYKDERLFRECAVLYQHELAHILMGHLFDSSNDPITVEAKEISVNDGWLRVWQDKGTDTVYPFVSLKTQGLWDEAHDIARELSLPDYWLQRYDMVRTVLLHLQGEHRTLLVQKGKVPSVLEEWGMSDIPVHDMAPMIGDDGVVLLVVNTKWRNLKPESTAYLYEVQLQSGNSDGSGGGSAPEISTLIEIHDSIKQTLLDTGKFQYDSLNRGFRYSPTGFEEHEREIRAAALHVNWSLIRTLLGFRRTLGYNRRRGHLYPINEQPLVTSRTVRRQVSVFIDSSGSVDDELLSEFIGTVKRSPFPVEIKYFSTRVADKSHTGGTDFKCIEDYLLQRDRYPDTVIVVTDGYAEANFHPQFPKRWYWIIQGDTSAAKEIGGTIIPVREVQSRT